MESQRRKCHGKVCQLSHNERLQLCGPDGRHGICAVTAILRLCSIVWISYFLIFDSLTAIKADRCCVKLLARPILLPRDYIGDALLYDA